MPNTHVTKNYFTDNGNELVIGGKLTFLDGAEVENFPGITSENAAPYVADSEATTVANLKADFNALLAALRTAGALSAATSAATEPETTDSETPAGETEGGGS